MATDVARLSFDPARHYTGVVPQQGRVSLEAEQNEQRTIDAEERRRELLEIVGPAGTPDNGYAVSSPAPGALTVGPGTMYVGGLRVGLDAPLDVQHQPDWLNQPPGAVTIGGTGHVLLTLTECDVAAVEDPALYEVALGGPDGAARARLLQHVEVRSTQQDTCASALADDEQDWAARGLVLDPATMQLASMSRLQASFQTPEGSTDPCEPTASGGYLGAENQLIRVQITDVNAQMGTFGLVWGYDDASMLYRVTLDPATSDLILDRSPVDDYHRPRAGQAAGRTLRPGHQDGALAGVHTPGVQRPEPDAAAVPAGLGGAADRPEPGDADRPDRHRRAGDDHRGRRHAAARGRLLVHRGPPRHPDRGVPRPAAADRPATRRTPAVGVPARRRHLVA